ncbi:anti-sigma factor [Streptomyces sp. NRRL S-87]|uniref:anti-sigma factor n=1 Tax=Streptomyces sp. NRRL S-87 TaxID=1463920 RepID=UPI00068B64F4|nr:anti-sigma factor [Streptomyces sp. NRRL S-87]
MAGGGPHDAVGAYVLDALPEDERRVFEDHLATCPECTLEAVELGAVAARLGAGLEAEPPPALRGRVLRAIGTVPQERWPAVGAPEPPPDGAAEGPPPAVSRPTGGARSTGMGREPPTAAPGAPPAAGAAERPHRGTGRPAPPAPGQRGSPSRRRSRRRVAVAVGAAVAAVLALAGVALWQHGEARDAHTVVRRAEQQVSGVADVLTAPDVQLNTEELVAAGRSTVAVSRDRDAAAFFATGLPKLPAGKAYELWFSDSGDYRPAGVLAGWGDRQLRLVGPLARATAVCITVEPTGGSRTPTSPVVAWIGVPHLPETPLDPPDPSPTDVDVYPEPAAGLSSE